MNIPNFFRFASSELSQDAFILWLLEWANPKPEYIQEDYELHKAAQAFVRLLLFPDGSKEELYISSIECKGQDNNIDVLALIKDDINQNKYAVIIEDKTDTTVHDNQLVRYSKDVRKRYKDEDGWQLHCVYFKTGNESKYSLSKIEQNYQNDEWVRANNLIFKKVLREDILMVLNQFSTKNIIFTDFRNNLDRIQRWTKSYKNANKVVDEWGNTAWQGFYMSLEDKLNTGTWGCAQGDPIINKKGNKVSQWEFNLPMLSIVEDDTIQIYLHLGLRHLTLKVLCSSNIYPQNITDIDGINTQLEKFGLKLEKEGFRKTKNSTLASIKTLNGHAIIPKTKPVDIKFVVEILTQLQQYLPELAKHIKIA